MEVDPDELKRLATEKIELGKSLQENLTQHESIEGVPKTKRKINQEIKFLQKALSNGSLKLSHVTCSNLTHFAFLVKVLKQQRNVVEVDAAVNSEERESPLRVDIICEGGQKWIKVIARNSKSIRDAALGESSFGSKSIIDQALEYISVAEQNPFMYKPPTVLFQFCNDIDHELKIALEDEGVTVQTTLEIPVEDVQYPQDVLFDVESLNIDITAMLAYVSALTNGSNCWKFVEPILNQQAEWEAQQPVKPILDKLFEGKRLVCCKTALSSFQDIVSMLGGPGEKQRAADFMKRLDVYEDVDNVPNELSEIVASGKIKSRSLKIFAFAIAMKAVTVTSNEGFIRSAKMKGVNIPVCIIQARALTESKEKTARRNEDRSETTIGQT